MEKRKEELNMAKLQMKSGFTRRLRLPLVLTLAHSVMKQLGLAEYVNQNVSWDPDHWEVSPGDLAQLLVLSTFTDIRIPLTHLEDRFEGIDISFFLGSASKSTTVNSFNAGRALERIGQSDPEKMYQVMALSAIKQAGIPTERLHADTTTVSFYGEYDTGKLDLTDEEKAELLQIERGYNKDGRPECRQVVVGQIVNEAGIPVLQKLQDGSTPDVTWNARAIDYLKEIQEKGFRYGVFVADSKLVTHDLVTSMNTPENRIPFVSRCPSNFEGKLEERCILRAYRECRWEDMGKFHNGEKAACYRGCCFKEEVCGASMRLLVLESSSLKEKATASLEKRRLELEPEIRKVEKKVFLCQADAEEEIRRFEKLPCSGLFQCRFSIEKEIKEKWPRGRRKAGGVPKIEEKYHLKPVEITVNDEERDKYLQKASCIVLISNVGEEEQGDTELVRIYKGQQVVENSFRELKSPSMASVIYLKNPDRIRALSMLLSLSLLIRAVIQYRMREGLKEFKEKNPNVKLRAGWGGRTLENPTYRLLYEHSVNCYFEKEDKGIYSYAWPSSETRERVETLLNLMKITLDELIR